MKIKNLAILIGLAVLFGALAYYSVQKKKPFAMPSVIGGKVLPDLAVNRVGKLVITSRDGVTTVARSKEKWVVASRFNYPANFDKVADTIRELGELKIGQPVNADPSNLGAFNLVTPVSAGTNKQANFGTLLELRDDKDGFLASLIVGKGFIRQQATPSMESMMGFGGYSDGQYVRTVDGKVYLVAKSLERMIEPAKTWLADDFLNVSTTDIKEITVSGPDRALIKLIRGKDPESFDLADLKPEEGTLESSKLNQMTGALNRLGFDDIADPALSLKETGLDRPVVFQAATRDGLIYTLKIGNALPNDSFDRYFTISVTNEPAVDQQASDKPKEETAGKEDEKVPEKKSVSKQAAELNRTFGSWIYVIKSYRAEPILLARGDLIKKPEPVKPGSELTNAPAVTVKEVKTPPSPEPGKKTEKSDKK